VATRIERRRYKYLKATSKRMVMGPFDCPSCGSELYFQRDGDKIKTRCSCGLTGEWPYEATLQPVDYYNKLTDQLRAMKS
jgi:transcription elongation factor Elf1